MPELPEVHTIATDLAKEITGWTISKVLITPNYLTQPSNSAFLDRVQGSQISGVRRIAKNIIIDLSNEYSVIIHLAMTGRLLISEYKKPDNWVRVVFLLKYNDSQKVLKFADMRMFGKVELADSIRLKDLKGRYGPEPVDANLTPETLLSQITSVKTNIKNALLDQSLVAGLGNIYATDTLFLSGIHPETSTKDIDLENASKLLQNARVVLSEGIAHRGSTLEDEMYVDIYGNPGTHQKHFRIYAKEVCPKCAKKVEFKKLNGRGTYFCPNCQTKPVKGGLF